MPQWGTFGQPQANFLHIQFQNKFAAQRALTRNGEQLSPTLIVGVKPLDPRHKAAVVRARALRPTCVAPALFMRALVHPPTPAALLPPAVCCASLHVAACMMT